MTEAKLRVERVSKTFEGETEADDVVALVDVTMHVDQGEFVSIVGPSGCGKSTLFGIVAGLVQPTSGQVMLAGHPANELLGAVGYMPQRDLLMPWRTVLDNAALGPLIAGASKREARARARQYFAEFGLAGFEERWPSELSGGMRQRAALLRTFLGGHDVLLLDEPFGALDALTRRSMQLWLTGVCETFNMTILFITHDVDEAVVLSDRVYVMTGRPGRLALEQRIEFQRPRSADVELDPMFAEYKRVLVEPLASPLEV